MVFDKVRENTAAMRENRQSYAQAANLAVNQTLVRSINTSLVALIPVGAILYVGAVQLGSGHLKDLALALFVGMAAGAYSSIFIATPLLVHMKSSETAVKLAERRARARQRALADPYAAVPSRGTGKPVGRRPEPVVEEPEPAPTPRATAPTTGRGRAAPPAHGPVHPSRASGRNQPSRKPRSKRGKK